MKNNINKIRNLFLQQSYLDSWNEYEYLLKHTRPIRWDWFVITASNEAQAESYRMQIDHRIKNGWLPSETKYVVIPDPIGKRVGSGGATLNVIRYIKENSKEKDPFTGKRIVILHSGGDSKRVPQYSACGKLFSKVPRVLPDGRCSTLFDEFVISLSGVPGRMADGLLVMSGDVLLLFNPLQIDLQREGSACISIKAPVETGSHHGVFLPDSNGKVKAFLHKQSEENLIAKGAVNEHNNIDIDTGAIWVGSGVLNKLIGLISKDNLICGDLFHKYVNEKVRLSFYGDFVYPMASEAFIDNYLLEPAEGEICTELIECRKEIFEILHNYPMHLIRLSPAEFIHFGTTKELLHLMLAAREDFAYLNWGRNIMSEGMTDAAIINSFIEDGAIVSDNSYIEDSFIKEGSIIGENSVVSCTSFSGKLPSNTVVHSIPIILEGKSFYVTRIYGIDDNPKNEMDACTFLTSSLKALIKKLSIDENALWTGKDKSLWNTKLYPVCETEEKALEAALILQKIICDEATEAQENYWINSKRLSLKESFEYADMKKTLLMQETIEDKVRINRFISSIESRVYYKEAAMILGYNEALERRLIILSQKIEIMDFTMKHRLYLAMSRICYGNNISNINLNPDILENLCYQTINKEISSSRTNNHSDNTISFIKEEVNIGLPIRVNFGGGWSDTPPYCLENGGTVLNAALSLNGDLPIKVTVKRLERPIIVLESKDTGALREFINISELQSYGNPSDPFAIHKAALIVTGIIPKNAGKVELKELLSGAGGGLYICTDVDVPKGSGLGTSSILAGALVKALFEIIGKKYIVQDLFQSVLHLEQIMTTGGGWQDQVGGLVDGIKLSTSKCGISQQLKITPLNLDDNIKAQLNERFVLVYTGQRRLARNLLREITGKYILNDPSTIEVLNEIQYLAVLMSFELERGNINKFIKLLNDHWDLSKKLDAGSTNTFIDQIIEVSKPFIDGVLIAGAGGGGFLQMFLKVGVKKEELSDQLNKVYQGSGIEIWETDFRW